MTIIATLIGVDLFTPAVQFWGLGIIGGSAPEGGGTDDGRAKKINVPSRVRVVVFERSSMLVVAATMSSAGGVWRVNWVNPSIDYVVVGYDDRGVVNAAIQDWVRPHVPEP